MLCLCCRLWEVYPEAVAGLCASCEWSIRLDVAAVVTDEHGNPAVRFAPIGDDDAPHDAPYDPPAEHAGEYRAQLVALAFRPQLARPWQVARAVIADIRAADCEIYLNIQYGRAMLSHPRRVPYPTLVRFVEWQTEIEDELTREWKAARAPIVRVEQIGGEETAA